MAKVRLRYLDLQDAYMYACGAAEFDVAAFIRRSDGQVFVSGLDDGDEAELPADLGDEQLYAAVPDQRSLDLGNALAFAFAEQLAPQLVDAVHDVFRRRGAWRVFRDLLDRRGLTEAWYAFKDDAERAALTQWAQDEGFEIVDEGRGGGGA
jgi:hypothetical protein